jgi:phospholipid/cholesterol/gamma-HCH transport system substrate-binding protein
MAEQTNRTIRVGALMLAGIAILAIAIFSMGGELRMLSGSEELEVHFQRVNGLQTGAPVYLSGVNVGSVASIRFPTDRRANYVVVRVRIEANAIERVRTDSVAKIESLGLLGDKYLLLTAGSNDAPSVQADTLLPSQDPVNYASLLQARGTGDLLANVIAISSSMRQMLDTANQGNGILAELIRGPSNPKEKPLTLASIRQTLDDVQKLTGKLNLAVDRIESGQGVLGALLSPQFNGRRMVTNITSAVDSLRTASARIQDTSAQLHDLVSRMNQAKGLLPQLMEDQKYAGRVMSNLRRSSDDMREVLDKINGRQGTLGLLVNDPRLYNNATNLVSANGWGFSLFKDVYSVSHPFSTTASPSYAPPVSAPPNYSPATGTAPPAAGENPTPAASQSN